MRGGFGAGAVDAPCAQHGGLVVVTDLEIAGWAVIAGGFEDLGVIPDSGFILGFVAPLEGVLFHLEDERGVAFGAWDLVVALVTGEEVLPQLSRDEFGGSAFYPLGSGDGFGALLTLAQGARAIVRGALPFFDFITDE